MNKDTIDAKCPYCKDIFKTSAFGKGAWASSLWGEYAPSSIKKICENCGEISVVSVSNIIKYSAKKIKKEI